MKIAVASDKREVAGHFGHCEKFMVFEVKEGEIIHREAVSNPGHKPGFLPNFLNDLHINVIISGGMGAAAVDIFNSHNIEVVVGASGDSQEAVLAYLNGDLESTGSVCHKD